MYAATRVVRASRSCICWVRNSSSSRYSTNTVTSRSDRATTPANPSVRRPWSVFGQIFRTTAGIRCGRCRRSHLARSPSGSAGTGSPGALEAPGSALGERVADTTHRHDEGGHGRIVLDLVAQMADMDVDRLLVLVERLVVAKKLEELAARVDAARAGSEVAEDLELGRGQADP